MTRRSNASPTQAPSASLPPSVAPPLASGWRTKAPPAWLADWRVERLAVAGGEIEAVECGAGPPLVLLPPLPGWKESFVALVPHLARRFRVLACDLRSKFTGAPSWEAMIGDLETIARARFGGPVLVLGHSFGGALALRWAAAHPERVRALVVSSGFARVFTPRGARAARYIEQPAVLAALRWLPDARSSRLAARWAARQAWVFDRHCGPAVTELVRFGVRNAPPGLIGQRIRLALETDARPLLAALACPILLVRGELDTPFAIAASEELAEGLLRCERALIPGAGHLHPLSRPEVLAEITGKWLELREG